MLVHDTSKVQFKNVVNCRPLLIVIVRIRDVRVNDVRINGKHLALFCFLMDYCLMFSLMLTNVKQSRFKAD